MAEFLIWAADKGHDKIVHLLVERGANMDLQNEVRYCIKLDSSL